VAAKRRFQRKATLKQEPTVEIRGLALPDEASLERLGVTLARLRELNQRVERGQLEPEDWALVRAIVREML
jgi:hypothetical protein